MKRISSNQNAAKDVATIDLIKESEGKLLAVSFSKTTSKNYPLAANLAQSAEKYKELVIGKTLVHYSVFSKEPEQAARALSLLRMISGWKDTTIFAGGKILQSFYRIQDVIDCYLEASGCNDHRAHCYQIINDPYSKYPHAFAMAVSIKVSFEPEPDPDPIYVDRYAFPCKLLHSVFNFEVDHPSSPIDQIQAQAVSRGCDACPLFDASDFKKTGGKAEVIK
ncbi:MAG: hypothetical protein K9K21_02980 [Desulfotignum sp.]|nr:hypothetical protein [Desulfotignum sp.]